MARSYQLTEAEWKLMRALWELGTASAREILENLEDREWAYSTIKTMLARLVEKGFVKTAKQHNVSVFTPVLKEKQARRSAFDNLIERAFGGVSQHLLTFLASEQVLSDSDKAELRRMLEREANIDEDVESTDHP